MPERLQKILAQAGYGSRRACEDFISAGRVRVNGRVTSLGEAAAPAHRWGEAGLEVAVKKIAEKAKEDTQPG